MATETEIWRLFCHRCQAYTDHQVTGTLRAGIGRHAQSMGNCRCTSCGN